MELTSIALPQIQSFLLSLARTLALISALPAFTGSASSLRLKIGLAAATALLLFPVVSNHVPPGPFLITAFGLMLVNEVLLGLLLGLIAQLVFAAINLGGTIVGYQMGFAAANVFDPQTSQQLSLLGQFVNIFAMLIFLALDGHHFFFRAIVESYQLLPPGIFHFSDQALSELMRLAGQMFLLGVKFSAPVLALLLISNLVLGVLSRVFPQLNAFMLSFPINIGIALLVIGLTLNMTALILSREFDTMYGNLFNFFWLLN